jgi:hypothetical protein
MLEHSDKNVISGVVFVILRIDTSESILVWFSFSSKKMSLESSTYVILYEKKKRKLINVVIIQP